MPVNYGTISISNLHPGLSEDQLLTMVSMAVENQLISAKREHYNEILNQCIVIAQTCIPPLKIHWDMNDYTYDYHLSTVNTGSMASDSL